MPIDLAEAHERARELEKHLADQGKIIEGGWAGFRVMAIPDNAPPVQIEEMRNAFFAGAQHLFTSMMSVLESGDEPTEADMRRISLIDVELTQFLATFMRKNGIGPNA